MAAHPRDPRRILVIDDDPVTAVSLLGLLQRAGHDVTVAGSGREGLRSLHAQQPDLITLDVTMPDMSGWETLQRIRELSDVPVMMLTASDLEMEKVRGLKGGADDYQTKPWSRPELLARVAALLRRAPADRSRPETYLDSRLEVDFQGHEVKVDGAGVALTPLEFRLLSTFVNHPNSVLSHEQLLEHAWGEPFAVSRGQVKTYVRYLRRKLAWEGEASPIESVRGVGYRYRAA
jgi:DNA-binding response OmpR family regulator